MDWGHLLFGFSGRINRAKYWLWVLLYLLSGLAVAIIVYVFIDPSSNNGSLVAGAAQLIVFITGLAVMTKRLHDRDKSAWWLIVFLVIPTIFVTAGIGAWLYGILVGADGDDFRQIGSIGAVLTLVGFAFILWSFVELACLRGSIGPNKYGPDPLEGA